MTSLDLRRFWMRGSLPFFIALILVLPAGGCAWRAGGSEHYLGPILFRYSEGAPDKAAINQVVAIGGLAEVGRQWGLSLGVVDRIAVLPRIVGGSAPPELSETVRWSTPLGALPRPEPGRWHVSWFYLRLPAPPSAWLLTRRLYGAQIAAGSELSAASLGITAITRVHLPGDAIGHVDYNPRAPLSAVFSVWPVGHDQTLPLSEVLKEVTP